jgi:hypothetical protein
LAAEGFRGLSQLQFHLQVREGATPIAYQLDDAFLQTAAGQTQAAGVMLQVRPFAFDGRSLRGLLDLGIRWFVTDAPMRFHEAVVDAKAGL